MDIKDIGAQGDVLFIKVDKLPEGVTKEEDLIVAHSETGHNHVAEGSAVRFSSSDPFIGYLATTEDVEVKHLRGWDTHETMKLLYDDGSEQGETIWEIRRQREHTPEGWRMVMD
jgi:hypothetical protein